MRPSTRRSEPQTSHGKQTTNHPAPVLAGAFLIGPTHMKAPEPLDDHIRRLLRESGLSGYEIGKRAGLTPSVVTRYTNCERTVTSGTAEKLLSAIGYRLAVVTK